jgi:hypothetical protein
MSEARVQQLIRLELSSAGAVMFRNNVGAYKDASGRLVRYGVCNPGGSDLIGWQPVRITPDMVGRTLAVFTAVEVKAPGGRITPAQQNFLDVVRRAGGFSGVARSEAEARQVLSL